MALKTKVVEVKEPPKLTSPEILMGVRDRKAAEDWGTKHGHAVVYYIPRKQKVYAERLQVRVDQMAEQIEQASAELVSMAEGAL